MSETARLLSISALVLLPLLWALSLRGSLFRPVSIVLCALCWGAIPLPLLGFPAPWEYPAALCRFYLPLLVLLTLFWAVSNVELVKREGYRLRNICGTLLGLFYCCAALTAMLLPRFSAPAFVCRLAALGVSYGCCFLFGCATMALLAAVHRPKQDKDCIIILGCSISKSGGLLPLLKSRTNKAIRFAWDQEIATGKSCRFVPSGGQGSDEIISEGSAMELYLLSHGAEQYEILPEKESTTTRENFLFSKRIIDEAMPNATVAFSTTNYHVLRGGLIAHSLHLPCEGIASPTTWYFWPNGFARELVALFVMSKKWQSAVLLLLCALSAL